MMTFSTTPLMPLASSSLGMTVFKGIYACVLLIFITTFSFSQNSKWEFGVGLRPFQMENEPYNLILKYQLSRYFALRTGVCFLYSKKNEDEFFIEPKIQHPDRFFYSFSRTDQKTIFTGFLGIQYGKKSNNFFWYGATEIVFRYRKDTPELLTSLVGATGNVNEPLGPYYSTILNDDKIKGYGMRQSFGIQYYINRYVSVSIEAGLYYEKYNLLRLRSVLYSGIWYDKQQQLGLNAGGQSYESQNMNLYNFIVSPLSALSLFYHF